MRAMPMQIPLKEPECAAAHFLWAWLFGGLALGWDGNCKCILWLHSNMLHTMAKQLALALALQTRLDPAWGGNCAVHLCLNQPRRVWPLFPFACTDAAFCMCYFTNSTEVPCKTTTHIMPTFFYCMRWSHCYCNHSFLLAVGMDSTLVCLSCGSWTQDTKSLLALRSCRICQQLFPGSIESSNICVCLCISSRC